MTMHIDPGQATVRRGKPARKPARATYTELSRDAIRLYFDLRPHMQPIAAVKKGVSEAFGIPVDDLNSKSKERGIGRARGIAMAIVSVVTSHSCDEIARRFNRRDGRPAREAIVLHRGMVTRLVNEVRSEIARTSDLPPGPYDYVATLKHVLLRDGDGRRIATLAGDQAQGVALAEFIIRARGSDC